MVLSKAWAIDGGTTPASLLRMNLWEATRGGTGIILPGDLRVSALPTPGGAVSIARGGCVAESTYGTAGRSESYGAVNDLPDQLAIPSQGSSGPRTEFVIVRFDDYHYNASTPPKDDAAAAAWQGCRFDRVSSLANVGDPFVPLAQLDIPANTQAISNAMITKDLRQMANPQQWPVNRFNAMRGGETETLTATKAAPGGGEYFPNAGGLQSIDIPSRATRVLVRAQWHSLYNPANSVTAELWVAWGDVINGAFEMQSQHYGTNNPAGNDMRNDPTVIDDMYIPVKYRGRKNVPFRMYGAKTSGTGAGLKMDGLSGTSLSLVFVQVADPSDS